MLLRWSNDFQQASQVTVYMYDFLIKRDALIILTITVFTRVIAVVLKMARVFLS